MMKFIAKVMILLFLLIGSTSIWAADAFIRPYARATTNQKWYVQKKWNKENIEWIDHLGMVNTSQRYIGGTSNSTGSNGRGISIVVTPDLEVVSYTLRYANIERGWSIANVAPGVYDFKLGKWYGDMTDEEKTAMWVAYTNKVAQAEATEKARREAPAKFDVSRSVEDYEIYLLGDRVFEDLTPAEKAEIRRELAVYRKEWTRVNDPENFEPKLLPASGSRLSEQQKIKSRRGFSRRLRINK